MNLNSIKTGLLKFVIVILGILTMGVLAACGGPGPTGTPTPAGTPIGTSTGTPHPMVTPTPIQPPPGQYQSADLGITWGASFCQKHFDTDVQKAVDAGVTWDRLAFEWGRVMEPRDPPVPTPIWQDFGSTLAYDPNQKIGPDQAYSYDTAITNAKGQVLGVLTGGVPWEFKSTGHLAGAWQSNWTQFITEAIDRYGYRISAWEIGNEDGLPVNLELLPEQYLQALQIACQQLGPNATVLLGSPFRDDSHFVALGQATATDRSNMYSQILTLLQDPVNVEWVNSC